MESTSQVPDPKWVDFDDDIERFGREGAYPLRDFMLDNDSLQRLSTTAQEIWNRIYPSHPTPWVIPNQQDQPPHNGPPNPLDLGPHSEYPRHPVKPIPK